MCSSYTCNVTGNVLVADADTTACASIQCSEDICCTQGFPFNWKPLICLPSHIEFIFLIIFFSLSSYFSADMCETLRCPNGQTHIIAASTTQCTSKPCSSIQCCIDGAFIYWMRFSFSFFISYFFSRHFSNVFISVTEYFPVFLTFSFLMLFFSVLYYFLEICVTSYLYGIYLSAPKCSTYTKCSALGMVPIAEASTTACAEAICTEGECCTEGIYLHTCLPLLTQ